MSCLHPEVTADGRCIDCGIEVPLSPSSWYESAADLLAEPDPGPTPFLIEDLVVDGAVAALVGQPKARKTWTLLELAIAVATGGTAFGRFAVPEPGPVLVIVEESGRAALHRRLSMLTRGRAIDAELLRPFHFAANRRVRLDVEEWRQRLLATAGEKPWRLIAFDPFVRVKGHVNENDQHEVGPVLDFLRELRDASGGAVLYNHHTPHDGTRQRGSSDFEAYWESKLTLAVEGESRTLEAEHRETEAAGPYELSFRFHAETRTLRIDADEDEFERTVREYEEADPEASANDIVKAIGGNRARVLEIVKRLREGGSDSPEPPGTTPSADTGSGEEVSVVRSTTEPPRPNRYEEPVPDPSKSPSQDELDGRPVGWVSRPPMICDPGFVEHLYNALERERITESEFHRAERAHRFVVNADENAK